MDTSIRFCFELEPAQKIEPRVTICAADPNLQLPRLVGPILTSTGSDPYLDWYTLTRGRYWLPTPLGEVFRYRDDIIRERGLQSCYATYEIGQLLGDVHSQRALALRRGRYAQIRPLFSNKYYPLPIKPTMYLLASSCQRY